jgi:hypothetical protein
MEFSFSLILSSGLLNQIHVLLLISGSQRAEQCGENERRKMEMKIFPQIEICDRTLCKYFYIWAYLGILFNVCHFPPTEEF